MKEDGNKRIAKNTIFLYIRMFVVLVMTLFTTRIVLKNLGTEDYGIYNVVCGFVAMFSFINTTLSGSINRYYNYELGKETNGDIKSIYSTSVIMQLVIAIALFIIIEIVGLWYINYKMNIPINRLPIAKVVFQISVISLMFVIMQAPYSAAVMAYEKMNFFALVSIFDAVLKLIIAFLIGISSYDKLLIYSILLGAISVLNFCLYFIYSKHRFNELVFEKRRIKHIKNMLSFSGWNMLETIAYTLRGQGSNMVLNFFFGPLVNAAYGVANQAAVGIDSFSSSISLAFRPQIIQSFSSGKRDRMNALIFTMSKVMFLLNLMIFVPSILEMDAVMQIWLSDVPKYAVEFTCMILMVKLVNTFNPPLTNAVMANGNTKLYMICVFFTVSSVVPISYLLFRINAQPIALFMVMLLLTVINQIIAVVVVNKIIDSFKIKDYLKAVCRPCLLHLLIVSVPLFIIHYFIDGIFCRTAIEVVSSILITVLSGYFIISDDKEKKIIDSLVGKYVINISR